MNPQCLGESLLPSKTSGTHSGRKQNYDAVLRGVKFGLFCFISKHSCILFYSEFHINIILFHTYPKGHIATYEFPEIYIRCITQKSTDLCIGKKSVSGSGMYEQLE